MKTKWIDGNLYPCRKHGRYPQIYIERVMHGKYKGISISFFEELYKSGTVIILTKRMATILNRQINYCLKGETK